MKALGVDPGLVRTGYGVLEERNGRIALLEAGHVESGSARDDLALRLRRIYEELVSLIQDHHPDVVAVEQLYSHYEHPRTAILMGHARGVIVLAAGMHDVPVHHYQASQVKSALTGSGRASKSQIQEMVRNTFGLMKTPDPPDVADAVAVGLCHIYHQRFYASIT